MSWGEIIGWLIYGAVAIVGAIGTSAFLTDDRDDINDTEARVTGEYLRDMYPELANDLLSTLREHETECDYCDIRKLIICEDAEQIRQIYVKSMLESEGNNDTLCWW